MKRINSIEANNLVKHDLLSIGLLVDADLEIATHFH